MSQRQTFRLQPGVVELADAAIRRVETGDRNAISVPPAGRSGVSIGLRQMDLGQNPDLREALIRHGRERGIIQSDEQEQRARQLLSERYGRRIDPRANGFDPEAQARSTAAIELARQLMREPGADAILRQGEIDHLRANAAAVESICRNAPERARAFCNSQQGQVEMLTFRHQSGGQADQAIRDLFSGERVTIEIQRRRTEVQLEGNMDVEQFRSKIWDNTPYASDPENRRNVETRRNSRDEFYRQQNLDDGSRARINPGQRSDAGSDDTQPQTAHAQDTEDTRERSANIASSFAQPDASRVTWRPDPAMLQDAIASVGAQDLPGWAQNLLGRDVMSNGAKKAVMGFQTAINDATRPMPYDYRWSFDKRNGRIDVDGDLGPQTRGGFGRAVDKHGEDGFAKRYATNQFGRYVKAVDQGRATYDELEDTVAGTLGQAQQDAAARLQASLNKLHDDREEPGERLKIDGWIGPKTTEDFRTTLYRVGSDRLQERFDRDDFWGDEDRA